MTRQMLMGIGAALLLTTFGLVGCETITPCQQAVDKSRACWRSVDCSKQTDANTRQGCEMVKATTLDPNKTIDCSNTEAIAAVNDCTLDPDNLCQCKK